MLTEKTNEIRSEKMRVSLAKVVLENYAKIKESYPNHPNQSHKHIQSFILNVETSLSKLSPFIKDFIIRYVMLNISYRLSVYSRSTYYRIEKEACLAFFKEYDQYVA